VVGRIGPHELYGGRNKVIPDGITTVRAMTAWHEGNDRVWTEAPPKMNPEFTRTWFLRCQDLIDKYRPDLLYFDNIGSLPFEQTGLDITAYYYNASRRWHRGKLEAVVNTKGIDPKYRSAVVEDYERGASSAIQPAPWQTDTCIGDWHYKRSIFEQHQYKSVSTVVRMLANIVSKNGNLLLNIPLRGNGASDEDETTFLKGLAVWMNINGPAIFATRPWKVAGEGPATGEGGMFNERTNYGPHDIRFTTKAGAIYAFSLGWPTDTLKIKSFGTAARLLDSPIANITLLGSAETIKWTQGQDALTIEPPAHKPCDHAVVFKVIPKA
jgi:alpha-L-fucosidase